MYKRQGNIHIHNHVNTTGISSASNFKTGSSNLHSTGLTVGDSFVHSTGVNASSMDIDDFVDVGNNIKLGNAGVITATSFTGSGANLTSIPAGQLTGALPAISGANLTGLSGVSVANQADNRLITATGTTDALNGEANLTFSGSLLSVTGNISLPDSTAPDYVGNIYVGNNSDLKIFHNGSDNFIRSGAGNANIRIDNNSGVLGARFIPAGAAELYHNGTKMCETSANGLAFPSGKGIDFSADASGTLKSLPNSFNAEVLHDYENGTFTPNIQYDTGTNQYYGSPGSGHYVASSKGEYIRIGDMVWAAGEITLTGNRNSTQTVHISIGGMPYNGLHSSQQNSLQTGWGGAAWPKNDSNASYRLIYSYHGYTTLNFYFYQAAGNNGIDGFRFHVYYRCAP